ncbi:MAG: SPOR domain-containing protein [Pseudohongiellaceae bacterium]
MSHDFAKIRPEPLLDKKPAQAPPAWSMMVTGILVGMALGVFGCVLLYLSGRVPPPPSVAAAQPVAGTRAVSSAPAEPAAAGDNGLQLEFYTELPIYEVPVDATPVDVAAADDPLPVPYLLQSGAFQQRERAEQEMQRQQSLGLQVRVRSQQITGRTLFLVQSGPYRTHGQLAEAERILRRNNIGFLRTSVE